MIADIQDQDNHQYLSDARGNKTHIVLPLEEYQALLGIHPEENEELTTIETSAIQEGLNEIAAGEILSAQEVAAQLGFSSIASVSKS